MEKLRQWREANGYTLEEAGHLVGVTKAAWQRYERGRRTPEWQIIARISAVTEGIVTANDFTPEVVE